MSSVRRGRQYGIKANKLIIDCRRMEQYAQSAFQELHSNSASNLLKLEQIRQTLSNLPESILSQRQYIRGRELIDRLVHDRGNKKVLDETALSLLEIERSGNLSTNRSHISLDTLKSPSVKNTLSLYKRKFGSKLLKQDSVPQEVHIKRLPNISVTPKRNFSKTQAEQPHPIQKGRQFFINRLEKMNQRRAQESPYKLPINPLSHRLKNAGILIDQIRKRRKNSNDLMLDETLTLDYIIDRNNAEKRLKVEQLLTSTHEQQMRRHNNRNLKQCILKMSLEAFIDIRFGDPVLALTINMEGLAYGTALGRILYYNFTSREETVISEFSEEYIRGIHLSLDNTLFIAIGDLKGLIVYAPEQQNSPQQSVIQHEKQHNTGSCAYTQVLMHQDSICLFTLQPANVAMTLSAPIVTDMVYVTNLQNNIKEVHECGLFPALTVPMDYDGSNLLWLQWDSFTERTLRMLNLVKHQSLILRQLKKSDGDFGPALLLPDGVLYVHNRRVLKILDFSTGVDRNTIGSHKVDIVAITWIEIIDNDIEPDLQMMQNALKMVYISVDVNGQICMWESQGIVEVIRLSELQELTEEYRHQFYFSMGYPYYIAARGPRIVVSTDIGVLLIRSKYLEGHVVSF